MVAIVGGRGHDEAFVEVVLLSVQPFRWVSGTSASYEGGNVGGEPFHMGAGNSDFSREVGGAEDFLKRR